MIIEDAASLSRSFLWQQGCRVCLGICVGDKAGAGGESPCLDRTCPRPWRPACGPVACPRLCA